MQQKICFFIATIPFAYFTFSHFLNKNKNTKKKKNEKSMPKGSRNGAQNVQNAQKGQRGRQRATQMPKLPEKRHAKNDAKIWCRKWISKWCQFDYPGGRREVRRASLRRRRFADAGFFYLKRLTPAGVGGFWDPWKFQNRSTIILSSIDGHFGRPKFRKREVREPRRNLMKKKDRRRIPSKKENH